MKKHDLKITIGIACFNAEETIKMAVESALAQDWQNFEIIAIDDGSEDKTETILLEIARQNNQLKILKHKRNLGYPACLNSILAACSGEFIAFFDSDDVSCTDRLRKQVDKILSIEKKTGSHDVFCYSNRNVVRTGQTVVDHEALAIGRFSPEPKGKMVADFIFGNAIPREYCWGMFGSCTLMARKDLFKKLGRFDERFRRSAELDMAIRLSFVDGCFVSVNEPLVTQYKTQGSYKAGRKPLEYSILLRQKYKDYLKKDKFYIASLAVAHSNFYSTKKNMVLSRFYRLIAFSISPKLLINFLRNKLRSNSDFNSKLRL